MSPYYELRNFCNRLQPAHADRPERPGRQIDGTPSIGALPVVNGLESAVCRSVRWISRWRQRRTAIRELQDLSDHYLTDIELDRSRIVSTVEEIIKTGDQPA